MEALRFQDLELSGEVKKAIAYMGFEEATPIQSESILPIMGGRDVVAQAPTGTGKTCAFGIPLIENVDEEQHDIWGLILCPTRELVIQTTDELIKLSRYKKGLRVVPIYGGQNIERQIGALKKRPQIIVATPGRLMDHMRRKTIRLESLQYVVLDEADEMLDMGFRDDIDTILDSVPTERQTVLFSATMSREILGIAKRYLKDPKKIQVTKTQITVPSVDQYYLEVSSGNKMDVLARLIDVNNYKLSIVFCNTKRMADELAHEMMARGYSAQALHGDMRQIQRDNVMKKFKSGDLDILVATDVAARGIDIDDIEAVFNYDLPTDLEYYVHRIGRTGRANRSGTSYTFVGRREMYRLRDIMRYTNAKIKLMKIPKISEIEEVRSNRALQDIVDVVRASQDTKCTDMIEKFLEEEENQDITTLDLAAAFLSREIHMDDLKEIESPERGGDRRKSGNAVRLFMNVGKLDKIKKKQLLEMLEYEAGVDGRKVKHIDIMEKFTFVDVTRDAVEDVISSLQGIRYRGRRMNVEVANRRKTR